MIKKLKLQQFQNKLNDREESKEEEKIAKLPNF